jgi:hypothetical protein
VDLPIFAMLKKPIIVNITIRIFFYDSFQFTDFVAFVVAIEEPLTWQ